MKIRNGFVSNSSSSCFICDSHYGKKYTPEQAKEILIEMTDAYNTIFSLYNNEFEKVRYDEVFEDPRYVNQSDIDMLRQFHRDVKEDSIDKDLVIYSVSDNTIPRALFDMIEEKFHCWDRIHLG